MAPPQGGLTNVLKIRIKRWVLYFSNFGYQHNTVREIHFQKQKLQLSIFKLTFLHADGCLYIIS